MRTRETGKVRGLATLEYERVSGEDGRASSRMRESNHREANESVCKLVHFFRW